LKHRAEVQLQLPTAGAAPPNPTRVTLHQESVLISDVKNEDGTQYYQVSWCDKRGRSHVVRSVIVVSMSDLPAPFWCCLQSWRSQHSTAWHGTGWHTAALQSKIEPCYQQVCSLGNPMCYIYMQWLQVWKRYSRFLDLRSELSEKVPPVKDLPFPKKKLKKKKDSVR
jgi:hypothetical protein